MGCYESFYGYADSDGDFMSDGWELAKDLNYTVAFYAGENPDYNCYNLINPVY